MFQMSERTKKWVLFAVVVFALPTVGISISPGLLQDDPLDEVLGTFAVSGRGREEVSVGDFEQTRRRLFALYGGAVEEEQVWNTVILSREARAAGLRVTDAELRERIDILIQSVRGEANYRAMIRNLRLPSVAHFEEAIREEMLVQKLKETYWLSQRYPSAALFEEFRRDDSRRKFKLDYVTFEADRLLKTMNPLDYPLEKVREYYTASGNDHVRRKYMGEDRFDVEVVYARTDALDPAKTPDLFKPVAFAGDEEERKAIENHYTENRWRYARPKGEGNPEDPAAEYRPLEEVRDEVRREVLVGRLVEHARKDEALTSDHPDLRAVARRFGLSYARSGPRTNAELLAWREVGEKNYALTSRLGGLREGQIEEGVNRGQTGLVFFSRLRERRPAEPPPLEQVELKVREDLMRKEAQDRALALAREFKDAMEAAALAELEPAYQAVRDQKSKEAEEEIARDGVTDPAEQARIRELHKSRGEGEISRKKLEELQARTRAAFDKVAAEKGLEIRHIDLFSRRDFATPAPAGEPPAETFLKRNHLATSLREKGEVSPPIQDDVSKNVYLVRAVEIVEPAPEEMDDSSLARARQGLDTKLNIQMQTRFDYKIGLWKRVDKRPEPPPPGERGTPITPDTPVPVPFPDQGG